MFRTLEPNLEAINFLFKYNSPLLSRETNCLSVEVTWKASLSLETEILRLRTWKFGQNGRQTCKVTWNLDMAILTMADQRCTIVLIFNAQWGSRVSALTMNILS